MPLKIATWNTNSVRRRAEAGARPLRDEAPDAPCPRQSGAAVETPPFETFAALEA